MAEYNEVVAAMPYFGNITFYRHLLQGGLLIDVHEHYVKQSLRNRCELAGPQGRFILSVPIHRPSGLKTATKDIRISYAEDWQHDHLQALRSAYGSSPFFIHYWDDIAALIGQRHDYLIEFNLSAHTLICELLDIPTGLAQSESYVSSSPGMDIRAKQKRGLGDYDRYIQVFEERHGFLSDLSILDTLFCLGPDTLVYLQR